MTRKVYVASSWRNQYYPRVVELIQELGHEVYDFRNPPNGSSFAWNEIDPEWGARIRHSSPATYRDMLKHPRARKGFNSDYDALTLWADTCVLVMPAGRSACFEAGIAEGMGLDTLVYIPEPMEPELMFSAIGMVISEDELKGALL